MHSELREQVERQGAVPLVWAAATAEQNYVNLGDALSPVIVALLSGRPIVHRAHNAQSLRMAAVGTIGHSLEGGTVELWGTGASRYRNPLSKEEKLMFAPSATTRYRVHATRGPVTRALFGEGNAVGPPVFGDPVWMLPDYYRPTGPKRYDLGVIVHLSDLADRTLDAQTKPELVRYHVPEEYKDRVKIIHTVTAIGMDAMKDRLDEILSCRRLVSTSLHGMVFAESYGIPCLYFAPRGDQGRGLVRRPLDPNDGYDLRITDLYLGLGRSEIPVYIQPRKKPTNWHRLMKAIDTAWQPVLFDTAPLAEAFPLPLHPLTAAAGKTVFDDPLLRSIPLQHGMVVPPQASISPASSAATIEPAVQEGFWRNTFRSRKEVR